LSGCLSCTILPGGNSRYRLRVHQTGIFRAREVGPSAALSSPMNRQLDGGLNGHQAHELLVLWLRTIADKADNHFTIVSPGGVCRDVAARVNDRGDISR